MWISENEGLCVAGAYQEWAEALDSVSGRYCADPSSEFSGELAALVALYHGLDGPNWPHQGNWLDIGPLHLWHGIETDENGRVTSLRVGEPGDPELEASKEGPPKYIPRGAGKSFKALDTFLGRAGADRPDSA